MGGSLAGRIAAAFGEERGAAGIAAHAVYRAGLGSDGVVMPPTFPEGSWVTRVASSADGSDGSSGRVVRVPYLVQERWLEGRRARSVTLDQEPSQANRVEQALLGASDAGRVALPLFEMRVATPTGVVRLTSLDLPHRYADAYLRDSQIGDARFDVSPVGSRLRAASPGDVRPLFEREPYSLLFGGWDSHRKGRWAKFPRVYQSAMYGLDPLFGDRRGGRVDPVNLVGAVDDKNKQEGDWKFVAEGQKTKGQKLSEIGHGHIAPGEVPGGVSITEARRSAWLSVAGLERLGFGDASIEAARWGRATLAALALAGDRLAFGRPSVWLRSGCDLVRVRETLAFDLGDGQVEEFTATADEALEAFAELRETAASAGLTMAGDIIEVQPIPSLAQAIEYAMTKAVGSGE